MNHLEHFYRAKYHFTVVQRMFESYDLFPDKRIIIGVINEAAKSASNLLRSYFLLEGISGKNMAIVRKVSLKHLETGLFEDLLTMLEIEKAQKTSPIEFKKDDRIIFLIDGKYRVLLIERLRSLVSSLERAIEIFPK